MAPLDTMTTTKNNSTEVATLKVPAEFAKQLREQVGARGMTILGAFRVHGPEIIRLIGGTQPATYTASR